MLIALVQFILHLWANSHDNFFRDELYYMAAAQHLSAGYVEFPPFVALVAAFSRAVLGSSVLAIRLLPALAGALMVLLTADMVAELGGGLLAQALAAVSIAVGPVFIGSSGLLTMDPFDQLWWTLAAWVLVRMIKSQQLRTWRAFGFVVGLGLLSSFITAIIAALVLAEIVSALHLPRKSEARLVVIACFSIGLGAVLTPLGEPLATIAIGKLKGEPYNADFFFLLRLLGTWVIPLVLGLGVFSIFPLGKHEVAEPGLTEDKPEHNRDIFIRALKVYVFVLALVFLGTGFTPLVDKYLALASPYALYWINIVSAILDNATLTAAEITPLMSQRTIQLALLGLLIAGGILIPGNIPNIICASKLKIQSKEWARLGVPLGLALMVGWFLALLLIIGD